MSYAKNSTNLLAHKIDTLIPISDSDYKTKPSIPNFQMNFEIKYKIYISKY